MAILARIKSYAYLIGAALLAVGYFVLRIFFLKQKRDKYKADAEQYKAQADQAQRIMEEDIDIENQTRSRRAEALREIKETSRSSIFRDPNRMRDRTPED